MQLPDPRLAFPELVVVGVLDDVVPERDGIVQEAGVQRGQRTGREIPREGVVDVELEVRVRVLVRFLEHAVLERVALAERAEVMHVVVHPPVHGRCLLAHRLECGMRLQQGHRRGQPVVQTPYIPTLPLLFGTLRTSHSMLS